MRKAILILVTLFIYQNPALTQVIYPANWWTGMKDPSLQLLFRGEQAGKYTKVTIKYPGVTVQKVSRTDNPDYLFAELLVSSSAKPGRFKILLTGDNVQSRELNYELKQKDRDDGKTRIQGVNSIDFTYLVMPDRFANGDPSNDNVSGYRDPVSDRSNKVARHGGDLKGIEDRLDYFNELGITTIWLTPVFENDMPRMREGTSEMSGYHGYWITDHYRVDKRLGGEEAYKSLIRNAHKKGLKIIQDAIYNHVGLYHWINQDPPAKDWINQWPEFTGPSHREETMYDPHGSPNEKLNMEKGWFTPHLPDLNLDNPLLATYMIQHAIWSVEEFGFDGFRIDTYKYCEESFVNKMNDALLREFPTITTFVEAWSHTVVSNAYFVRNNMDIPFKHNAMGAIDFPLCFAMQEAMKPAGITGVDGIYITLAQDLLYKDPMNNCVFLDNHDMDRIFSLAGEDWNKMKWGLTWILTIRGIPQIYYGTEILMKNLKIPNDAEVRYDFPGGWPGDTINKFTSQGRSALENTAFDYLSRLAHFRKGSSALSSGKMMQYLVRNGVYVFFRYDRNQTVMVITNSGNTRVRPDWEYYAERTAGFSKVKNVVTGEVRDMQGFEVKPGEILVLELVR